MVVGGIENNPPNVEDIGWNVCIVAIWFIYYRLATRSEKTLHVPADGAAAWTDTVPTAGFPSVFIPGKRMGDDTAFTITDWGMFPQTVVDDISPVTTTAAVVIPATEAWRKFAVSGAQKALLTASGVLPTLPA